MKDSLIFQDEPKEAPPIPVSYGQGETPVGKGVIFWDKKGALCGLAFAEIAEARTKAERWGLHLVGEPNSEKASDFLKAIFEKDRKVQNTFTLRFKSTPFQSKVWKVLSEVPFGETWTYQDLARKVGKEKAVRAVGTTMGKNPLSFLLPCHRIVRSDGTLGHYGWGPQMKKKILDWEAGL
ncbi:MAG: methylated-DNA--[protein]-cysteine S-methyltransferase [bacterium]|nr:methylated-DNA--[protein]-cysteine S-methyltransferase [bacterium]